MVKFYIGRYVGTDDAEKSLEEFSISIGMSYPDLEKLESVVVMVLENAQVEFPSIEFLVDMVREIRDARKDIKKRWNDRRKEIKAKKK